MAKDPQQDAKETVKRRSLVRSGAKRRRVLRVVYSADATSIGRELPLEEAELIIGRGSGEQVSISDARMSRKHVRITPDRDGVAHLVEDLGTSNGTFIDGTQINERTPIAPNQVLSIGETLLVVDEEPDPESMPAGPGESGDEITGLIGRSFAAVRLRRSLATAARGQGSVLLLGATGTGKEVAAEAIHRAGDRAGSAYVTANCAAIPAELAEAKLFGTAKGDYTGAVDRKGVFDEADGGTLFLDELGDLPPALQPKLLRVLENGSIQSLTGATERRVDVRVIGATLIDLERTNFRRDLLGRFTWVIRLPALADRRSDVLALWEHFLRLHRPNATSTSYTAEFAEALLLQNWPMNVREVKHLADRLVESVAPHEVFDVYVLPAAWQEPILARALEEEEDEDPASLNRPSKAVLEAALVATEGNVLLAAQQNGWARTQLYRWLRYARINPNKFRK